MMRSSMVPFVTMCCTTTVLERSALPPEPRNGLLIKLQAPGQSEPHDGRTAALEIQPMSRRCRMDQRHRQLAIVPSADTGGVIQL